jgi:hypothetical protein
MDREISRFEDRRLIQASEFDHGLRDGVDGKPNQSQSFLQEVTEEAEGEAEKAETLKS